MGLRGEAAIVGYVELPPERLNKASLAPFAIEQWAELSAAAGVVHIMGTTGHSAEQEAVIAKAAGRAPIVRSHRAPGPHPGGARRRRWVGRRLSPSITSGGG